MRKLIPIIIALLAFSCAKMPQQLQPRATIPVETKVSEPSDIKIDFERLDTVYFVSSIDIEKYIHFKKLLNPKTKIKSVTPFEVQGVTLFYVVNYDNGWEIISADKRTQPVLGRSEKGSFSMKNYEETPWATWAYTLGLDVLTERMYGPEATFTNNENLVFWGSLTSPSLMMPEFRDSIPPVIHLPVEPIEGVTGYYELEFVTYSSPETVSVDHLTTTRWDQGGAEWETRNEFVPFRTDVDTLRSPSGCVAVAGAQMAYFLHNKIGKPTHAPSAGYCVGTINNFSREFYNLSTQIWDDMWRFNTTASDMLCGYIGWAVNMNYGNKGSGALTRNLRTYFDYWGISCDIDFYDSSVVFDELRYRGMPVIVGAKPRENVFDGHSFIIDCCKYERQQICYMYMWHWYEQYLGGLHPMVEDRYEYSTQVLGMTFVRMNWGWGDIIENNWDFAPNGTWEITVDEEKNKVYHFDWIRRMLYGFQEI